MTTPTESPEEIHLTPLESLVLWALACVGGCAAAGFAASLAAAYWIY
jgi:hypothetical protein